MADTRTQNNYTGNGSNKLFTFTFPYLKQSDVRVKVNGTDTSDWTFHNATTIETNQAPANNAPVIIYRDTDNEIKKATFYPGSAIKAEDLNDNIDQILYTVQEVDERAQTTLGDTARAGNWLIGVDYGISFDGTAEEDPPKRTTLKATGPANDNLTVNIPDVSSTGTSANLITNLDQGTVSTNMIANDAVTFAKIKNISDTNKILGRQSAGAGDVQELSPANVRTMLSVPELTGSTDNTICTVTGANAIQGESNLTFNGGQLLIKGSDPNIRVKDDDGTNQQTYLKQAGSNFFIDLQNNTNNGNFSIRGFDGSSTANHFKITAAGRCGIGNSDPQKPLHITRADDAVARIEATAAGNSARLELKSPSDSYCGVHFGDTDADAGRIRYYHDGDYFVFGTSVPDSDPVTVKSRMWIANGGKIRIGEEITTTTTAGGPGGMQGWDVDTGYSTGKTVHVNGNIYEATGTINSGQAAPSHSSGTGSTLTGGGAWRFKQTQAVIPNLLQIDGYHIWDGANDYGITINSFEPAITLCDRSGGYGSSQIRMYQSSTDGSIELWGDETNNGSIGHTANATDWLMARFEKETISFQINNSSALHINSSGNVGIGKTSPSVELDVQGAIEATGSITGGSDIAYKKDVQPIDNALDKVTQLLGVNFTYKSNDKRSMGFIAQDVEKIFPELVKGEEGSKSLNYMGLTGALVEAIKELSDKIKKLETN